MLTDSLGGVSGVFAHRRRLEYVLAFESALARALARAGVTTADVADAIVSSCNADAIDLERVTRETSSAGNDAIPVIEQLRELVARTKPAAAAFVHHGATSQDVIDMALILQLRDALALFDGELRRLVAALAQLARAEAETPMAARTWMQHALPTTFGFKAAGWLDGVQRSQTRIGALHESAVVLQFGGAVGTLAALGPRAREVSDALGAELGLSVPAIAWHTTRDRLGEVATTMGLLTATLGKIARDLTLMTQSEVDEVREPAIAGRGRSSTMPQKRNPVGCAAAAAAAVRVPGLVATVLSAMVQEHERALGGWQAEWDTIPQICILTFEALEQLTFVVSGLEVKRDRMAANLDITNGLIFAEPVRVALAASLGPAAQDVTSRAIRRATDEGRHLRDVLLGDADVRSRLSREEVENLFDPRRYLGLAAETAMTVAGSTGLVALTDTSLYPVPVRR
jgi:3-carboxy-cis,cis-muconate cycloisomerase